METIDRLNKIKALQKESVFEIDRLIADLNGVDPPQLPSDKLFTDIDARWEGNNILVTFTANTDKEINIRYAHAADPDKEFSVHELIHDSRFNASPLRAADGKYRIGGVKNTDWLIWLEAGAWDEENWRFVVDPDSKTDAILVKKREDPEDEPKPVPTPELSQKKITVHEDDKMGVYTPAVNGFFEYKGKYRCYAWDRRQSEMLYFESDDLEHWSKPKTAAIQERGWYLKLENGDILFYREKNENETGVEIKVFDVSGDLKKLTPKSSYGWRLDGALLMNQIKGTIYSTGRVRGSGPKNKGGWGGDLPVYPTVKNIPQIEEAFDKYAPAWLKKSAIDELLKDRRGISLHTSNDNGKTWSRGKIIAAPEWYKTPETAGWNIKHENGIADFYSSVLLDGKRMLVKLYKKEKDRVIERGAGDMNYPFNRRFRFTGETIIVPALFEDGRVKLISNESVIPRQYHDRKTPKDVPNATCKSCTEFGQTSPYTTLKKGEYVYVVYGYRDDIHYEADWNFTAGVYIARIPKDEFDKLFK